MKKDEINQKNSVNVNISNININFSGISKKQSLLDMIYKMIKKYFE